MSEVASVPGATKQPDWASILKAGNPNWFGHKDYYQARRQGVTNMQIRDYLDRIGSGQQGGVRMGNVRMDQGGHIGGVYKIANEAAELEKANAGVRDDTIRSLETSLAEEKARNEKLFTDTTSVTGGGANPVNTMAIGPNTVSPQMDTKALARKTTTKKKTTTPSKSLTSGLNIGTSTGMSY